MNNFQFIKYGINEDMTTLPPPYWFKNDSPGLVPSSPA